jgi:hypothetical protein
MRLGVVAVLFLLCASGVICEGGSKGRGFGDNYDWKSLDAGIAEAEASGKPAMVVIHKSWCGACKVISPLECTQIFVFEPNYA